jgi:hypothetical protein
MLGRAFILVNFVRKVYANHPQEDLAKFGYSSERKVEFFFNLAIF